MCANIVSGNQLQWLRIVLTKFVVCESTFIESWNKRRLLGESEQLAEILLALARSLQIATGSINTSRDFITDGIAVGRFTTDFPDQVGNVTKTYRLSKGILQRSAVWDALNQFQEPRAPFQRHSPVQFHITNKTHACNQLRAVFTSNCQTCLCQKPCMSLQNSRRSLAQVAAAC